jgi:hypothetical protein
MMKRVVFGILWCVVIYFGACMITGGIAGGIAGSDDPKDAFESGAQAGAKAVSALRLYFLFGAVFIALVGTWLGWLPGTRQRKQTQSKA